MSSLNDRLIDLIKSKAYIRSEQPFTLASGKLSHDYVDMRFGLSAGADLNLACLAMIDRFKDLGLEFKTSGGNIDAIGGMTMGADPICHGISIITSTNWFSVRKQTKDHGTQNSIEGYKLGTSDSVILVDDTVTSGSSLIKATEAVMSTGAEIKLAASILDRGTKANDAFKKLGVPYASLVSYRDLDIEPI